MIKIVLFASILLLYAEFINDLSCNKEKKIIVWRNDEKLAFNDFKEECKENPNFSAKTYVGLKFDYLLNASLKFDVICFMDKYKSCVLEFTDYVLNHEQGHFNIGEIYARMLRKAISEIRHTINSSSVKRLDSMYYYYGKKMLLEQKLYDKETTFPERNETAQLIWDQLIKHRLDSLSEFARDDRMDVRWKKKIKKQ